MKTPQWWYKRHAEGAPWWRFVLWPLALIWKNVNDSKRHNARPYRSNRFIVSVGNATLGGSGKTPVTAEILRLLDREGVAAAGLSRGYGGAAAGPLRVDAAVHTAAEVGDEPLMLAQNAEFWVARDRAEGLRAIERTEARIVVLDDAHQNVKIHKDLHVFVVDGDTANGAWPFGDGGICPYGPLREPIEDALDRADICVLWMPDATTPPDPELLALLAPRPTFVARLDARPAAAPDRVVAFAGLAKPWKFEATLKSQGYDVRAFGAFADHVSPSPAELEAMTVRAAAEKAALITTQKDWVRLDAAWRARISCLPIVARFADEAGFVHAVTRGLAPVSGTPRGPQSGPECSGEGDVIPQA